MRKISYAKAINEAQHIAMQKDGRVFQIGVGINTPWYVGKTMEGLLDNFGDKRLIDTPVSENGITGVAIGAALAGMKPILTFPRMDFMYYAMDQICNHAATLNYSLGGNSPVPIVIRAIINRKGEQAAQHSQALHGLFMHIPGLKIIMPSDAFDAKGMFLAALEDNNPILYIEDRELYSEKCDVPEDYYTSSLTKAKIVNQGTDLTLISSSYTLSECKKIVAQFKVEGISIELIDLRTIKPLDAKTLIDSVKKTKKMLVVDGGWQTGGVASEIISLVTTEAFSYLSRKPEKLALPDLPAPASYQLEKVYYPTLNEIANSIKKLL